MDVRRALFRHSGFPPWLAGSRRIVVADVDRGLRRQFEQSPHRAVELARVAAGKIGACGADIRHEHRIADEYRVTDEIGHVGRRVARHMQGFRLQSADAELLAVRKQVVELAAVGQETALQVEQFLEHRLHLADMPADGNAPAQLLLDVARAGQVVGMGMGLEDPVELQALAADVVDHPVGRSRGRPPRLEIVVQHRIDHRGAGARGIRHHIGHGEGFRVEKGFDVRGHGVLPPAGIIYLQTLYFYIYYCQLIFEISA